MPASFWTLTKTRSIDSASTSGIQILTAIYDEKNFYVPSAYFFFVFFFERKIIHRKAKGRIRVARSGLNARKGWEKKTPGPKNPRVCGSYMGRKVTFTYIGRSARIPFTPRETRNRTRVYIWVCTAAYYAPIALPNSGNLADIYIPKRELPYVITSLTSLSRLFTYYSIIITIKMIMKKKI